MKTHDFRLVLSGPPDEGKAERLYSSIDDGTFSIVNGTPEIWFDRDANSLEEAIASAISDAKTAGFDVARIEIEPEGFPVSAVA